MIPFAFAGNYSLADIGVAIIIIIAIVAMVGIFIKVSGVVVPPWVWHILLILVAAVLCIAAIRFLVTM